MATRLTIVMPCHNRCDALGFTLASLCLQTAPSVDFELLIVDQASTDGSRELAQTFKAPFRLELLEQDAKYGISTARNAGIQAAQSEFVLLLDADLIADHRLVEAHLTMNESRPDALLSGRVLPFLPAYNSYVERIAGPDDNLDRGVDAEYLPFYQCYGGHLSFPTNVYKRIGPFDPLLKGFEDIDFAYRASRLGYSIINNISAVSYHNHPRTLQERFQQARAYNRMLPILFDRYPEIQGKIPLIQDFEPLQWRKDWGTRLMNKLRVRAFGLTPVQLIAQHILKILNQCHFLPRLVRFLYWQLLIGNWYLGFRDGASSLQKNSLHCTSKAIDP